MYGMNQQMGQLSVSLHLQVKLFKRSLKEREGDGGMQ